MKIAKKYGIGVVSVFNSSHVGAVASACLEAGKKNFIAFGFTNADALMISHNSTETFFGTNPICFGFPSLDDPIIWDIGTS